MDELRGIFYMLIFDSLFLQLSKLYDLSEDEERRNFLDKYLAFMSVNGMWFYFVPSFRDFSWGI